MLIVLPPSETKADGGDGAPLDLGALSFPELNEVRRTVAASLLALDDDTMRDALKISPKLDAEIAANRELWTSPTMPAIQRYTGVLYDALDAGTLDGTSLSRIAVGSALFGLVRADDPIPRYRLSGGSRIPERGAAKPPTMKARWGTSVTGALRTVAPTEGPVVDLRSGAYLTLGPLPGAITVRVESVQEDGSRKVVSHFNKHYKGVLARVLATADRAPGPGDGVGEIAAVARAADLTVEITGPDSLTLVV
ncbi:peroxide stress protein YaaA [Corynebacterium pygosceleis]|uniref:peroxide stress protein YaaA n=1 Tax=Corynebacterium pygosceleis TaxID=2800406 RepID=UPI0019065414|nr:peroxide stress protein YaaA [Corynebacterium pygosceleis]MCK7674280.1 peroxide stress protein YaaA [Corynebacterium pygosceleis]MCL0120422.1 peroxide stress protein YaaA [Corynebacterium pygosceleis]